MRNFFQRLLRNAVFFVAWTAVSVLAADELNALLAQPPSASLTREDAGRRVEMLRALVASHPERADEIEAYLIPFVRAMQPPPAKPAPTPVPRAPKARPLILVKSPDGATTAMRALSYRRQGAVVLVTGENKSHAVFQAANVAGELPWYAEKELESGAVNLGEVAARYETFAKAVPAFQGALKDKIARLRGLQASSKKAATDRLNTIQARVDRITSAVYDPAPGYTAAALAKMLLDAEKVRMELPDYAGKIDAWVEPFREHFAKLLSGRSYVNGAWVSNDVLARQAYEKRQAAFLSGLDYQLGMEAAPTNAVRGLVMPPLVGAGFAIALGLGLVLFGRRWIWLRVAGVALLAFTPLALASVFFLATRDPALLPATIDMADERPIVNALSQAAGLDEDLSTSQKISDEALNGFLARHVRIAHTGGGDPHTPERQAIAIRLLPNRLVIFQMVRSVGLNWIVRIDLDFRKVDGNPTVVLAGAKIGVLDCPAGLAVNLWQNLKPQFASILEASRIIDRFSVLSPEAGFIEILPLAQNSGSLEN